MATEALSHRATAVGLSGGLAVLLPAAAYAATIPFDGVHDLVASAALPLAVGAVAGVGTLAVSSYVMERRYGAAAGDDGDKRAGGAAALDPEGSERAHAAQGAKATPKGVPVISRAAGAMSDAEAWAELDAMLADDSPVSCDPARSKDVYQIAFEELQRTRESAAVEQDPADAAAVDEEAAPAGSPSDQVGAEAPAAGPAPDSTAAYLAIAASRYADAAPAGAKDAASIAARDAAMASLDGGVSSLGDPAPAYGQVPTASAGAGETGEDAGIAEQASAAEPERDPRDIWAEALAILAEEPVEEVPRPMGAHFAGASGATVTPEAKVQAIEADIEAEISMRAHVNELVEEELASMRPKAPRRMGREFFRVIQGGTTATLPRLQVEA